MTLSPTDIVQLSALTENTALAGGDLIPVLRSGPLQFAKASTVAAYVQGSVKTFGALGDGVTDDTSAIQAAINSGQSFYFPPGTYIVSATLTLTQTANHGQVIRGAGAVASSGLGVAKTIIKPTGAATVLFKIDGTPFGSYVTGVAFEDFAVDMVNMADTSASIAFLQLQTFDNRYRGIRVINFGVNKRLVKFGPGSFVTTLDTCQGGLVEWAGDGVTNPTTTSLNNCDLTGILADKTTNITFNGGAFQQPYNAAMGGAALIYLAANAATTPRGIPNPAGIYLYATNTLTNSTGITVNGCDFEAPSGFPATGNDGVHGVLNAYPVLNIGAGMKAVALINPSFAAMYRYDPNGASFYVGGNVGGGSPGMFFAYPAIFSSTVKIDTGGVLTGYSDALQAVQAWSVSGATGASAFGGLTVQALAAGVDGNALIVNAKAGTNVFNVSTVGLGSLSLNNKAGLGIYSDAGSTPVASIDGTLGLMRLYYGGVNTITLTPANGLISANGMYIGGNVVVGARQIGWSVATGTLSRASLNTGTATLAQVAQALGALITDLTTHGLIGP